MYKKQIFYRIIMLKEFLADIQQAKQAVLDELETRATDLIIFKRRFRTLRQLAEFESIIVSKIYNLETDDPQDFLTNRRYSVGISAIVNKSA